MIPNSPAISLIRLILVDYKSPTATGDNNTLGWISFYCNSATSLLEIFSHIKLGYYRTFIIPDRQQAMSDFHVRIENFTNLNLGWESLTFDKVHENS